MRKLFLVLLLLPVFCYGNIVLEKDDIANSPSETLIELLQTQPGIFVDVNDIHVNGYDTIDIMFLLDDLPISYNTALSIDLKIIEKLEVITSGMLPELTEVYPVVIRVSTLPKTQDFQIKVNTLFDQISGKNSWNKNKLGLSMNIPILKNLSVSAISDINRNNTRFREYYKNDPVKDFQYLSDLVFTKNDPYKNRSFFDERNYNNLNLLYNLKYDITSKSHLKFSHFINNNQEIPFDHDWKYAMEYSKEIQQKEQSLNLDFEQKINDKLSFKIAYNHHTLDYNENPQEIELNDYFTMNPDNFDLYAENAPYDCSGIDYLVGANGLYGDESDIPWTIFTSSGMDESIYSYTDFIRPGTIYNQYIENSYKSDQFNFLTKYELNENHQISAAVDFQLYNIKKYQYSNPWVLYATRYDEYLQENATPADSVFNPNTQNWEPLYNLQDIYDATLFGSGQIDGYEINPTSYLFYFNDKFEYEKFSGLIGLKGIFRDLGKSYKGYKNGGTTFTNHISNDENYKHHLIPYIKLNFGDPYGIEFSFKYTKQMYNDYMKIES